MALLASNKFYKVINSRLRALSMSTLVNAPDSTSSRGGFAKAYEKQSGNESFVKLLRNSQLVRLGNPEGKIVEGKIYHIVKDDLYIEFGGKFPCVCPRPSKNGEAYTLGKKVRIMLHDLELSTRFIGAKTDLTILEADGTLLGLVRKSPNENLSKLEAKSS